MKFTEIPYKVLKDFFLNVPGMAVGTVQNIPTYLIFCSVTGEGSVLPTGITSVQSGSTQNFVFYPDTENGYSVGSVFVDGVNVGTPSSYSFTNVLSDHTLVVNFIIENRVRYWVGEGGNWSDTGHWSLSSGGEGGEDIPTEVDTVIFDSNSITSEDQTIYFPTDEISYLSALDMTDLQYQISLNSYAIPQVVTKIACGYESTMVLTENGDVQGWGDNWGYQVNPDSTEDPWSDPSTVILSGVKDISCGSYHTMVLMENGDVHGWGENWDYHVNYNSTDEYWTDTSTVFMSGVKSVVCGSYHTMVLMENGDVHGWGSNWSKQVNPNSDDVWFDPSTVLISGVKQIAGGGEHTMVLMENGDVHGWGWNSYRQVNPLSDTDPWTDSSTVIFSGVKEISCGYYHTMVLMENGDVHGWGRNHYRQVNPNSATNPWIDQTTIMLSGVKQIAGGGEHTMVLMENGDVHGWGWNSYRQVNPNSTDDYWTDSSTVILSGVQQIVCGTQSWHTMALMENGDVHGWGDNYSGASNPYDLDTSPWIDASSSIPLSSSYPWEISVSGGTINALNCIISNSIASGGATFNAFEINNNVDGGNNTGWNFGNRVRYWISNNPQCTYDFYDSANWSYTSGGPGGSTPPTSVDDIAVFDANSVYGIGLAYMYQIEISAPLICHIRIDYDCSAIIFYLYDEWSLQEDISNIGIISVEEGGVLNTNDFDVTLAFGIIFEGEANFGTSILTLQPVGENYNLVLYVYDSAVIDSSMATINIDFSSFNNNTLIISANYLNFENLIIYGDGEVDFMPYSLPTIETTFGSCSFDGVTEGGLILKGFDGGS